MKNMLLILIMVGWCNLLVGQIPTTIRTPTDVIVDAIEISEYLPDQLEGVSVETEVVIVNQSFETVYSTTVMGDKIVVPTAKLPIGQYVLQISDKNGVYRKHLIVRH
ncbi:hypothetical protein [Negadavirga shengliensis]|uniref:Por secretion system C-terminal sorting domain-containing protein n=1 Tax=Negadavirga shengliensis TaxID=1389218 RepID=A0ABV9T497_9BACT